MCRQIREGGGVGGGGGHQEEKTHWALKESKLYPICHRDSKNMGHLDRWVKGQGPCNSNDNSKQISSHDSFNKACFMNQVFSVRKVQFHPFLESSYVQCRLKTLIFTEFEFAWYLMWTVRKHEIIFYSPRVFTHGENNFCLSCGQRIDPLHFSRNSPLQWSMCFQHADEARETYLVCPRRAHFDGAICFLSTHFQAFAHLHSLLCLDPEHSKCWPLVHKYTWELQCVAPKKCYPKNATMPA